MRFYCVKTIATGHVYIDDWINHKICRIRPYYGTVHMHQNLVELGPNRYYDHPSCEAHAVPDLYVILLLGEDKL